MKNQSAKTTRPTSVKRSATASSKARKQSPSLRAVHRRTYPLHKRMLLHPIGIFVLLCAGVFMAGWTYHAVADTIISSVIEAQPLTEPATIESPLQDAAFTTSPAKVTGACPDASYVVLRINGAFSGASWCTNSGYSITSSLYSGTNTLAVQDFNVTNLKGPTSSSVTITYTPPPGVTARAVGSRHSSSATSGDSSSSQSTASGQNSTAGSSTNSPSNNAAVAAVTQPLLLTSDFQFHTFVAQKTFSWSLDLEGGTPPYNVTVSWGDGSTSHLVFPTDPVFSIQHSFVTTGYYPVVVNSVDTTGQEHVMQLAALITDKTGTAPFLSTDKNSPDGKAQTVASTTTSSNTTARWLLLAWPFYLIVILMTVSFWLGEHQELTVLRKPKQKQRRAHSAA